MYKGKVFFNQKKGITLIALVITIIVMLVLAGVSLSLALGENGVLTRAAEATQTFNKKRDMEAIELELAGINAKSYVNQNEAVEGMLNILKDKQLIDSADAEMDESGNYYDYTQYEDEFHLPFVLVQKGDNTYRIYLNNKGTFSIEEPITASGGTIKDGIYLANKDVFVNGDGITNPEDRGKYTIEGNTTVLFRDSLGTDDTGMHPSGEQLSIEIRDGSFVKLYFDYDNNTKASDGKTYYFLTNAGLKRSAIDISPGATLRMHISENVVVTVDSGTGNTAPENKGNGAVGGSGGFAGIRAPEGSSLTIFGKGELIAIGGNAGDGGTAVAANAGGGRRRWRWSWNRWKWWSRW